MTVIVCGAGGQLGQELMRIRPKPLMLGYTQKECDITDAECVECILEKHQPRFLINATGYTNVDACETNKDRAMKVNAEAVEHVAVLCKKYNVFLIHISTDGVFPGEKEDGYCETDRVKPVTIYGKSKARGESAIKKSKCKHIIIRTSWLYSAFGHNFVKSMIKLAKTREIIPVVDNQYGQPTYAKDLAEMIFHIVNHPSVHSGIYHYSGEGVTTWYGFAVEIFNNLRKYYDRVPRVIPVEAFHSHSKRPQFSILNCSKIEKAFRSDCTYLEQTFNKGCKDWKDSLAECIEEILSNS